MVGYQNLTKGATYFLLIEGEKSNNKMTIHLHAFITPHAQRERGKVIGCDVHIYIYVYGRKKYLNRILVEFIDYLYHCELQKRFPLKSRISIFNAHLPLFVRRMEMTSHNSIGKYRHFSKLTWNLPWNGASPFADQTSRMQNWKEVNVWSVIFMKVDNIS